ncbi:MAG: HAMP domain-containing protein [Desulfobacteraceae bacterium]|nr:HAMP domain-containing protein [Desulfobacteraceae bacterium]
MTNMVTFFRNLQIRSKLMVGYTLIFIISTLAGGAAVYYQVKSTIEANIESELKNTTETILNMVKTAAGTSIKNHLRAVAETNKQIIETIYREYQQGKIIEEEAKILAEKILLGQTIGKTGYLYCVRSDGIAPVHPKPGVAGNSFLDQWFVREQIRLKEGYLEYDWKNPEENFEKPKALYMSYFKPWDWIISASSYRDEFNALVNVSDFKDSILALSFGKTGYAYVLDSQGNLIVHPTLSGNYMDAQGKAGHFFVQDICKQKNGKLVYSWKNPGETRFRDKIVLFNYIPEYDWIVACSSYLDEMYAPLNTIRNIILLTACLILALVFITSLWINSSVLLPLRHLMNRFALGASGDLEVRMPVTSKDEIGQLAVFFNKFMETLEIYHANLNAEIEKQKQVEIALRSSFKESKRLEREVLNISERERQKIAMDIHDDLCPQLMGIEVMTKILMEKLAEKSIDNIDETAEAEKIRQLILETIAKTRQLSRGLSPINLSHHGFDLSLEELATYVREVFGIVCTFNHHGEPSIRDTGVATHIYYIAHEAVHNAARHSCAKNISIDLTISEQKIRLKVSDDGKGMDRGQHSRGMGLKIMTYRADRIGAILNIESGINSNIGKGTLVQLDLEF